MSLYYRLGAFGFLAHPDFESTPELGDFNVGFLDQVEALKWVRRHIYAFGGDPARVTVNGQSAGASSIMLHLVSPISEGLFSGAIAQSVFRTPVPTPEQQEVCHLVERESNELITPVLSRCSTRSPQLLVAT